MKPGLLAFLLVFALGLALPWRVAEAHPHVWIDNESELVFEDGKLVAVRHRWAFDELFSLSLIEDFASDPEAGFTAEEIAALEENAFANLRYYGYFTLLRADQRRVALEEVRDFHAEIEGARVVYSFELRLPEPLDPQAQDLDLGIYDETYFVDVAVDRSDPLSFVGATPGECSSESWNDEANRIYFDLVAPLRISIDCRS